MNQTHAPVQAAVDFLLDHHLKLASAESCTAGRIVSLLSEIEGCGECLDCGFVVYSVVAKQKQLGVSQQTLDEFSLTSEEVALEMALGALQRSDATVALATTGLAGDEGKDGIPPGTVCFAWVYQVGAGIESMTTTERFIGERSEVINDASLFALQGLVQFYPTAAH